MKKIVLLLIMAMATLFATTVQAQEYDTLRGNYYPYYYYNYYNNNYNAPLHPQYGPSSIHFEVRNITNNVSSHSYDVNWCDENGYIYPEEIAVLIQPDSAIRVAGIAFCDLCHQLSHYFDSSDFTPQASFTDSGMFYFTLYDTNMNVIHSAIVNHDSLPNARYLYHKRYNISGFFQNNEFYTVHELYFDTGIDFTGNFYVGVSIARRHERSGAMMSLYELRPTSPDWPYDTLSLLPYEYRRYRMILPVADETVPWEDEGCHYGSSSFLWPILERPGDSCPEVRGLRWSRLGSGTTAFVQWDAGTNHRDWQLSYGPTGTPAGEGTVVDCPPAQCVLPGLAAGVTYDIYVRARCRFARDEWTGWSGPLEVGFGSPGEGIEGAATDIAAELTPNPATGRVKVACAEAMRKVEVYDMQGRRCLAQEVQGSETVLDISALAAGRYTVLLHTATATAAKALVVQ